MFLLSGSQFAKHEWLMANGIGGYCSSTATGMNSRKYHGLLIAKLPKTGSHMLLQKLEETISFGDRRFDLSTNSYAGKTYPEGYKNISSFSFSTHPTFTYMFGDAKLEKSVRMLHGKNAVLVSYRHLSRKKAEFSVRALLSPRPIHSDPKQQEIQFEYDRFGFTVKSPVKMRISSSMGKFIPAPEKYYGMQYETEKERGYPSCETLFSPGKFIASLSQGDELHLVASAEVFSPLDILTPSEALEIIDRQQMRVPHFQQTCCRASGLSRTDFSDSLLLAADSFVNSHNDRHWITAGFPWFSEWSRDSMISLPGLLLSTGRHALAREILVSHAKRMKNGLLPNFISDDGSPSYTSSDASFWFADACRQYLQHTGDASFIDKSLWKTLRSFLSSTIEGNSLLSMDSDCLIKVRAPSSTWMDAQVDGRAVTPRAGKPVEINALWYSNLHFIRHIALRNSDRRTQDLCTRLIDGAGASFSKFLSHEGWLFDTLEPNDASLRPNQIFAVSLPHSPLNEIQRMHVLNAVRSHLYTPLGLRTLSPQDANYHDAYRGNQRERDLAYHQGAIWPWLIGAYYDAQLRVHPGSERQILSSLRYFAEAMNEGCIGSIPELYEPSTMKPAGAPSQAWSVAEVLRIYAKVKRAVEKQEAAPAHNFAKMEIRY